MLRKALNFSIQQVCTMIDKGTILFDCPLQRPSEQWNKENKSLLIDSILTMFVPEIYTTQSSTIINDKKVNVYNVIDGLQRLTIIHSFVNDKWALTELDPIYLETTGEKYDISGKKFSELSEGVKMAINSYILSIKAVELTEDECEDEENIINKKIFYRLNNGKQVSREHLSLVSAPENIQEFIHNTIKENPVFKMAQFSEESIKKSGRQMAIQQSIILVSGLNYSSFAAKDVEKFFIENNITEEILSKVESAFVDISETFKEHNKFISKINIPMMVKLFVDNESVDADQVDKVQEFLNWYSKNIKKSDSYKQYCGSGNIKKLNVEGRITALQTKFDEYKSKNFDSVAKELRKSQSKIQSSFNPHEISDNISSVEVPDYIKEIAAHTEI